MSSVSLKCESEVSVLKGKYQGLKVHKPFFYWKIFPKMGNLRLKIRKRSDFGGFQSPEAREKKLKLPNSYIWFSLWSQKYQMIIKDLYFISGSQG